MIKIALVLVVALVACAVVANAAVVRSSSSNLARVVHGTSVSSNNAHVVEDGAAQIVETDAFQGSSDPRCVASQVCCHSRNVACPQPALPPHVCTQWIWISGCVRPSVTPVPAATARPSITPAPTTAKVIARPIITPAPTVSPGEITDLGCWKDGLSIKGHSRSLGEGGSGGIGCKNADKKNERCTVHQCASIAINHHAATGLVGVNIFALDEVTGKCFFSNGKDNYRQHGSVACKQQYMVVNHVYQLGGIADLGCWANTGSDHGLALKDGFQHIQGGISYGVRCTASGGQMPAQSHGQKPAPCSKAACLSLALSASKSSLASVSSASNSAPTLFGLDPDGKCYWSNNGADTSDYKKYGAQAAAACTPRTPPKVVYKPTVVQVFRMVPKK